MSQEARFVNCPTCHADISDDRELCPHCKTPVVKALDAVVKQSNDENVKRLTDEVVKLERDRDGLAEQVKTLTRESTDLRAENSELHKRLGEGLHREN